MVIARKKLRIAFFCSECGAEHSKWQGQCKECGQWNKLIEEKMPAKKTMATSQYVSQKSTIPDISTDQLSGIKSGIAEFDRVLGGQLIPGMTILLGGEPGIGKSTLLLQVAEAYCRKGLKVLYVTGEESLQQIKIRAQRLKVAGEKITVFNSSNLEEIIQTINSDSYQILLIDSIQTVATSMFDSPPGTVGQVRESAAQLINLVKARGIALFLVGHVTKDGMVAGPKVLEHMVDTVIYFEGDNAQMYRMLRAVKNRFGSVSEIGLFEMKSEGLLEVSNASSWFLPEAHNKANSGSVLTALCEGNRPILVEIQALVTPANYGNPQRVAGGFDSKRLALLLAILEKRCGYPVSQNDVFVSITGGLKVTEPAMDLPVMAAIVSSLLNKTIDNKTIVLGEVGLSGEIRGVSMPDQRVSESSKLGFKNILLPEITVKQVTEKSLNIISVSDIQSALDYLLK